MLNEYIVHNKLTLRQTSVNLLASIATVFSFRTASLDFIQAHLQSKDALTRKFYVKPRKDDFKYFGIQSGDFLELEKPLYGTCDSGDYWRQL